jgi:hypothetical protein
MAVAAIPFIVMGVAAAVGAAASIQSGQQQKAASQFNATVQQQNADAAIAQGDAEAARRDRLARIALGSGQASIGASGLKPEGSPLDLMESNAAQLEIQTLQAKYDAGLRARGYTVQSQLDTFTGDVAEQRGYMGAAQALLGGASSAYKYNAASKLSLA